MVFGFLPFITNPVTKIVKIVFVVFFSSVAKPPLKTELKSAWFVGLYLLKDNVRGIMALRAEYLKIGQLFVAKAFVCQVVNMKSVGTKTTLFALDPALLK
jgi:hypothetical protein